MQNGSINKPNDISEYKFDLDLGTDETLLESYDIKQKILSLDKLDFLEFRLQNGQPDP